MAATDPIKILFNEVQVTQDEFDGKAPDSGATIKGPNYGSISYEDCAEAGLFTFQLGAQFGPDSLDWIRVERIILYLDEAAISDVSLNVIPPEGSAYPIPFVRDLADWQGGGMERILHLANCGLRLRPGSSIQLITTGATVSQMAEVWWERERQIRQDLSSGNEVFAYGVN